MREAQWFVRTQQMQVTEDEITRCHVCGCQGVVQWLFLPDHVLLCERHYEEQRQGLLATLTCAHCDARRQVLQCDICGGACCAFHVFPTPDEMLLFGMSADLTWCIDCLLKGGVIYE